jgi:hypothetical protein
MAKLVLLSLLAATALIPLVTARDPKPKRAFRRTLVWMCAFNAAWMILVLYVLPHLG